MSNGRARNGSRNARSREFGTSRDIVKAQIAKGLTTEELHRLERQIRGRPRVGPRPLTPKKVDEKVDVKEEVVTEPKVEEKKVTEEYTRQYQFIEQQLTNEGISVDKVHIQGVARSFAQGGKYWDIGGKRILPAPQKEVPAPPERKWRLISGPKEKVPAPPETGPRWRLISGPTRTDEPKPPGVFQQPTNIKKGLNEIKDVMVESVMENQPYGGVNREQAENLVELVTTGKLDPSGVISGPALDKYNKFISDTYNPWWEETGKEKFTKYQADIEKYNTDRKTWNEQQWNDFANAIKGKSFTVRSIQLKIDDNTLRGMKANWDNIATIPGLTPEQREIKWKEYLGQYGIGSEGLKRDLMDKESSELLSIERGYENALKEPGITKEEKEGFRFALDVVRDVIAKAPAGYASGERRYAGWPGRYELVYEKDKSFIEMTREKWESGEWRGLPLYKDARTFEEFYKIRRDKMAAAHEWWESYKAARKDFWKSMFLPTVMPAVEMATFAAGGYLVGLAAKSLVPVGKVVPTVMGKVMSKAATLAGPKVVATLKATRIAAPLTASSIGLAASPWVAQVLGQATAGLWAGTTQSLYEMSRYPEIEIERRRTALKTAGYTKQQIEIEERKMREQKAYAFPQIGAILAKQVFLMSIAGIGLRAGFQAKPISWERMAIGKKLEYRVLKIGKYHTFGKTAEGRVFGYPKRAYWDKVLKKDFIPYLDKLAKQKIVYTPQTGLEVEVAFDEFLRHLPKRLQGTVILVDAVGKLRWVPPKLYGQIEQTIKDGFVRRGLSTLDATGITNLVKKYKGNALIFGSTVKELQHIPAVKLATISKQLQWLYKLRISPEMLHKDVDIFFNSTAKMEKFVSKLKVKFGNILTFQLREGTWKVGVKGGKQILDIHSPGSSYAVPQKAWGMLVGAEQYPKLTKGLIFKWKLAGLSGESISELASHGWKKVFLKEVTRSISKNYPVNTKTVMSQAMKYWSPAEIKQGWRIFFMSNRTKDTLRLIISGLTNSIEKYGLNAGLEYWGPKAEFLRRELVAHGISLDTVDKLLLEAAKEPVLLYAPQMTGYPTVILPYTPVALPYTPVSPFQTLSLVARGTFSPSRSPFPSLNLTTSKVSASVSVVTKNVMSAARLTKPYPLQVQAVYAPPPVRRKPRATIFAPLSLSWASASTSVSSASAYVHSAISRQKHISPRPPRPSTLPRSAVSVSSLIGSIIAPPSSRPSLPVPYPPPRPYAPRTTPPSQPYHPLPMPLKEWEKLLPHEKIRLLREVERRRQFPVLSFLQQLIGGRR